MLPSFRRGLTWGLSSGWPAGASFQVNLNTCCSGQRIIPWAFTGPSESGRAASGLDHERSRRVCSIAYPETQPVDFPIQLSPLYFRIQNNQAKPEGRKKGCAVWFLSPTLLVQGSLHYTCFSVSIQYTGVYLVGDCHLSLFSRKLSAVINTAYGDSAVVPSLPCCAQGTSSDVTDALTLLKEKSQMFRTWP